MPLDAEVPLRAPRASSNLRSGKHLACRITEIQIAEIAILLIALQFTAFTLTAAYLAFSFAMLHRRNQVSWESLLSRLHPAWLDPASPIGVSARGTVVASGGFAPWSAFREAGVLMQIADFADRHSSRMDPMALASLRADAIHIRFAALRSLIQRPRVL